MAYEFLGKNIEDHLRACDKTQKWLADQCDVTKGQISHIVHGRSYPSLILLEKISSALNIEIYALLDGKNKNVKRGMS